jgi:hypothetical protein
MPLTRRAAKAFFVALLFLSMTIVVSFGADKPIAKDTIWLGIELRLGLSRQVVMSQLAESYKLVRIGTEGDNWLVQSKNAPLVSYGQVSFENGKLILAIRDWTNGDEDSFAFAQSLHGALEQFGKENRHVCYVRTNTSRTPTTETGSITLSCGAKQLVIQTIDIFYGEYKGKTTDIQELLIDAK